MPAKIAVLIHGCHLEAVGWQDIVWGDLHGLVGRAPKGIQEALVRGASLVFWGTGASKKDGLYESRYTFNYARSRLEELADLPIGNVKYTAEELSEFLARTSFLDSVSQNTTEEIRNALDLCVDRGIGELYLVSSPTHIARCLQEATKVLAERGNSHDIRVYATASDTCFFGSTPESVVIVEPPHRGDLLPWQTFRYVRAMFGIMRQGNEAFAKFLRDLGDLLHKYGIEVTWKPLA